ncbi:hypothetical protein [Bartonella sp. LJL80]
MYQDPFDFLDGFPGWPTNFDLYHRQERSRTAGGVTIVKDMGSPLWKASYSSKTLRPSELSYWRARANGLGNGIVRFYARPTNCFPWAYPNGKGLGDVSKVSIQTITNNNALTFSGLPSGYVFTVSDKIQIGDRDLHDVIAVNGISVQVYPPLWPGATTGTKVTLVRPHCLMTIVPDSLSAQADAGTGRGTVSFDALEAR